MDLNAQLNRLQNWLWTQPVRSRFHGWALWICRYALALTRDLLDGQLSVYASSLVYASLLSLVPFLAICFSLLKALGAHNSLEPTLKRLLSPFGRKTGEISQDIIGFVDHVQVGVLGFLGVAMLLYTAISLIHKIEASFNRLWRLPAHDQAPERLGEFFALMIVGPVLVFAAAGTIGGLLDSNGWIRLGDWLPLDFLSDLLSELASYLLIAVLFAFLYFYIPRAPVTLRAAAYAGGVAGLIWQAAAALFASFTSGASNYNAIYSGFAIVLFVLLWVDLAWLILLGGCRLAFYLQHPRQMLIRGESATTGSRESEWTALLIAVLVFERFAHAKAAPTRTDLHHLLGAPGELIERCTEMLIEQGVIGELAHSQGLVPVRDAQTLTLGELWLKIRGSAPLWGCEGAGAAKISAGLTLLEQAALHAGDSIDLAEWVKSVPPQKNTP